MCNWTPLDRIWVWILSLSGSSCEIHRNSLTHEEIKDQKGWITGLRSYNSVSIQIQCCRIIKFGFLHYPKYFSAVFYQLVGDVGVTFLLILTKYLSVGLSSLFSFLPPNSEGAWIRMTVANKPLCISNLHIFLLMEYDLKLRDPLFYPGSALDVISDINNGPNTQGLGGNTFPAWLGHVMMGK